jgi:hypothetical protein
MIPPELKFPTKHQQPQLTNAQLMPLKGQEKHQWRAQLFSLSEMV